MDGDHTIERHFEVTERALEIVFASLSNTTFTFVSKVCSSNRKDYHQLASVGTAAEMTLRCMLRAVPAAVPGIVFLSGGQSAVRATEHLNALNQCGKAPWQLSFSFERALQESALKAWKGSVAHTIAAQTALHHRVRCNSAARFGKYSDETEKTAIQ
jgi:fructose-bisphosphate aldolase, class I